jgi:hypothetical protein
VHVKYAVTLNQENLPKGAEVAVQGLGLLENGKTKTFTEEDNDVFRQLNGSLVDNTDEKGNRVEGTHFELGPTILQAFKNHPYVTVEKVEETESAKTEEKVQPRKDEK